MNKFLLALFFLFPCSLLAQKLEFPLGDTTNKISYKAEIKVDADLMKVDLHQRAKDWMLLNFLEENKVLHRDDLKEGIIIGKAFAGYSTKLNAKEFHHKLTWTVTIRVKNGSYSYEMTDFYSTEDASGNNAYTKSWTTPMEDLVLNDIAFKDNGDYKPLYKMHAVALDKNAKQVIESLKAAMQPFKMSDQFKVQEPVVKAVPANSAAVQKPVETDKAGQNSAQDLINSLKGLNDSKAIDSVMKFLMAEKEALTKKQNTVAAIDTAKKTVNEKVIEPVKVVEVVKKDTVVVKAKDSVGVAAPVEASVKSAITNTQPTKTDSVQVVKVLKLDIPVVKTDTIKSVASSTVKNETAIAATTIPAANTTTSGVAQPANVKNDTAPAVNNPATTASAIVAPPLPVKTPVKALPEAFMPESPRVTMTPLGIGAGKIVFPISDSTNKVCYVGGIRLDSMSTKVELFQRAKDWILLNFQAENKVIHRDDLHNGVLIAKGFAGYTTKLNAKDFQNKLTWTMTITVKNGSYTYEMTDIYSSEYASGNNAYTQSWTTPIEDLILNDIAFKDNGDYKPLYKMHATSTDKSIKEIIESLKAAMKPFSVMNEMKIGG